jgi:ATPase family AAA domain-containing protein 1
LTGKRRNSHGGDYDSDDEHDSRRRPRIQELNLNTYEQTIAMEVVAPEEIPVTFEGTL